MNFCIVISYFTKAYFDTTGVTFRVNNNRLINYVEHTPYCKKMLHLKDNLLAVSKCLSNFVLLLKI